MADNDELQAAIAFRKAGNSQVYKFPEDLETKPDPRCNHCEKTVYKAELVTYNRIPYHKNCFRCLQCKKKLNPGEANPLGPTTFVCNVHFQQIVKGTSGANTDADDVVSARSASVKATGPSLVTGKSSSGASEVDLSAGHAWRQNLGKQVYRYPEDLDGPDARTDPRCQKCGKTCYKAEVVTYERVPYHKECFKCMLCKKKLTPGSANPFGEDTFLCNVHFQQVIKGAKTQANGEVFSASTSGVPVKKGPSLVTGDGKAVEVDLTAGHEWRKAGVKQVYRFPEDVSGPTARSDPRCQVCAKTVYPAEKVTYERIPYHKECFKCVQCKKRLTPGEANPFGESSFLCNTHFQQAIMGTKGRDLKDIVNASSAAPKQTGPSLVVGSATGAVDLSTGMKWRKAGIKQAYRYPEDLDGPTARADPRCQKCGKTTYKAETITYERIPYHKNCFKCVQCKRKLTAGDANPFGEDEYLCNVHYHQVVFGGSKSPQNDAEVFSAASGESKVTGPALVTAAASNKVHPLVAAGMDWRKAGGKQVYKYPEDLETKSDPRCNLCGKVAYKAEVVTYERIPYHKNCFKCIQCKKRLTAGTANPFGPDVYLCNAHFQQFALQSSGAIDETQSVVSAGTALVEDAGPSVVGGSRTKKKKTTYKPPKRARRGRK